KVILPLMASKVYTFALPVFFKVSTFFQAVLFTKTVSVPGSTIGYFTYFTWLGIFLLMAALKALLAYSPTGCLVKLTVSPKQYFSS
ncbi:MAG: hypothetical protein WKF91_18355, partial [Segetibacter sp.]